MVINNGGCEEEEMIFLIERLIEKGAFVNLRRFTCCEEPLTCAVKKGYVDVARFLLDNGAKVNAVNYEIKSPLFIAVEGCNIRMIELLIENCVTRSGGSSSIDGALSSIDRALSSFETEFFRITHRYLYSTLKGKISKRCTYTKGAAFLEELGVKKKSGMFKRKRPWRFVERVLQNEKPRKSCFFCCGSVVGGEFFDDYKKAADEGRAAARAFRQRMEALRHADEPEVIDVLGDGVLVQVED